MKTKHIQYQTHGTCSQLIDVTADENNVIQQVFFLGGCNGNLQGICALVRGMKVEEIKQRFHALVQINARSLIRKQPLLRRSFFDSLFREGLVDFVATDTHAFPGRGTCMTEGMAALKQKYGEVMERRIRENPEKIIIT